MSGHLRTSRPAAPRPIALQCTPTCPPRLATPPSQVLPGGDFAGAKVTRVALRSHRDHGRSGDLGAFAPSASPASSRPPPCVPSLAVAPTMPSASLHGLRRSARSQSAPTASPLMRSCNGPCPPARSRGSVDVFSSLRTFHSPLALRFPLDSAPITHSRCPAIGRRGKVCYEIVPKLLRVCYSLPTESIHERTSSALPRPSVGV